MEGTPRGNGPGFFTIMLAVVVGIIIAQLLGAIPGLVAKIIMEENRRTADAQVRELSPDLVIQRCGKPDKETPMELGGKLVFTELSYNAGLTVLTFHSYAESATKPNRNNPKLWYLSAADGLSKKPLNSEELFSAMSCLNGEPHSR